MRMGGAVKNTDGRPSCRVLHGCFQWLLFHQDSTAKQQLPPACLMGQLRGSGCGGRQHSPSLCPGDWVLAQLLLAQLSQPLPDRVGRASLGILGMIGIAVSPSRHRNRLPVGMGLTLPKCVTVYRLCGRAQVQGRAQGSVPSHP